MTDKLKKGELLEFLHDAKDLFRSRQPTWYDSKQERAYRQIVALIRKPEITEEWIEEKAKELCEQNYVDDEAKDFIRSLIEEIRGKH